MRSGGRTYYLRNDSIFVLLTNEKIDIIIEFLIRFKTCAIYTVCKVFVQDEVD